MSSKDQFAKGKFGFPSLLAQISQELGSQVSSIVKSVLQEAIEGHQGQIRASVSKEHQIPFIVHPVGVACIAIKNYSLVKDTIDVDLDTIICISLCHDLLEDTRVDGRRIELLAGPIVRKYVEALTKPPAGIAGQASEQRNHEMANQIGAAGPIAVYIKICDSMHNLSRPGITPATLLSKAIEKAQNYYLPLLENCPLDDEIRQQYLHCIEKARLQLRKGEKFTNDVPLGSLEDAMAYCTSQASGKILELHDVATIATYVFRPEEVGIWDYRDGTKPLFTAIYGSRIGEVVAMADGQRIIQHSKIISHESAPQFPLSSIESKTVVSIPMRTGVDNFHILVLDFRDSMPNWLSLDSISILVQFLIHRLIVSESDRRASLGREAAVLGLQFQTDIAAAIGITNADLGELKRWLQRCERAIVSVRQFVEFVLSNNPDHIALASLIRTESRVKSLDSILAKFQRTKSTKWIGMESMEDVAGVRVIGPTNSSLNQIADLVISEGSAFGIQLSESVQDAHRDYRKNPTSTGYKALHLILEVETLLEGESRIVLCELQLRTLFQDAWATLAHETIYHESKSRRKRFRNDLKAIGNSVSCCDDIAELIAGRMR